jgi:TolA-binding protein
LSLLQIELEADAEVERQRKERERQQKQHVLTLSETKDQICHLESRLSELKDEKHQLFLQLKKVLNEDETRKRQLMSQENEMMKLHQFNYSRLQIDHGGHHAPQMFLQPIQLTRAPAASNVYKVVPPQQVSHHNTSPHGNMPVTVC